MSELRQDIEAFNSMREDLELDHFGKWVVFYSEKLDGIFGSFEEAANVAVERYGRGPYLIKQVGAPPITLPASVLYRPQYGED